MAVALGFGWLLLHLELHQVEIVDIFDGQGTVWKLRAHGEIGGHVSPCETHVFFYTMLLTALNVCDQLNVFNGNLYRWL